MSPPEPPAEPQREARAVSSCPDAPPRLEGLRQRRDFLACARGRRVVTQGFILQARDRADGSDAVRVGVTASKKVGNAVTRNRAKRRLRALARSILATRGQPGHDYVLIARRDATVTLPYEQLEKDLTHALERLGS